ncbi:MAG: ATP-grasp domain-containing protein [Candidatus Symbiobacter sp.]|nr:ATP-grasp domain-containing protein [Candidatus Symbiobacter sp.]
MAKKLNLLILADTPEWQSRELMAAVTRRGGQALCVSISDLAFVIERGDHAQRPDAFTKWDALRFPDVFYEKFRTAGELDAVMVRGIAAGTFEQITLRLSFLHALEHLGLRVINRPRAIECCVDKAMTSFLLHQAGVPTPDLWVGEQSASLQHYLATRPAETRVVKPLFGAMGKNIRRLKTTETLPDPTAYHGVWYVQKFIDSVSPQPESPSVFFDYRVLVTGGRVIAAMRREHHDWITNVAQGGQARPLHDNDDAAELSRLALAAAAAVGADFAGVDVIRDRAGKYWVLEVNSMAAWQGLQSVINHALADDIIAALFS